MTVQNLDRRTRRRYRWGEIATMARESAGVWRLHPDLVAVNLDTLHHARRRARPLRPTATHRFEFSRGNQGVDEFGRRIFDLYIRFVPDEHED